MNSPNEQGHLPDDSWERFKKVATAVLAVPKSEIDKSIEKEKRKKAKAASKRKVPKK